MTLKCTYKYCGQQLNPLHVEAEHNGVHWFFTCPFCAFPSDLVTRPILGSPSTFAQPSYFEVAAA